MGTIGYGYGSEWHLLRHLGYHRDYLSQEVLNVTGGNAIQWLDFKFSSANIPLKDDGEYIGLEFITNETVIAKWKTFWPPRGNAQNWDAIGKIQIDGVDEWLLVEAKGHLGEIKSNCGATNLESQQTIQTALQKTSQTVSHKATHIDNWLKPYYQYANRLAVLHFLMNECDPPLNARLLFIYFYGENRENAKCPQNKQDWLPAIAEMKEWLGIDKENSLIDRIHELFLPVNLSVSLPRPATR